MVYQKIKKKDFIEYRKREDMIDLVKFKKEKRYSKWRNRMFHQLPIKIYQKLTKDPVVFYHYAGKKILNYEQTNIYIYMNR